MSRSPSRAVPAAWAFWRDYDARLSPLKIAAVLLALWPAAALGIAWSQHALGSRPITEVLHGLGDWTVRLLLLTLAVTPARVVLDWPAVVKLRRPLGVTTACYAGAHLLLYCLDQNWQVGKVASEVALRFYLTIGFAALLMLGALAVTSTDDWQKRLGRRWKLLHRLIFLLLPLALWHYFLQSKSNVGAAVLATGLAWWLIFWRLAPRRWQARIWLLPVLAVLAALAAAGTEGAWYGLATGVQAGRVLAANLDLSFGPRPAVWVLICGLAVPILALLRRLLPRRDRRRPRVGRAGAVRPAG